MNPTTYLIAFEVSHPSSLDELISVIKSYGTWARITENTWAITTTETAVDVRKRLLPYVGTNGRLFVIRSGRESAWSNVHCSSDWLKKNL